MLLASVGGFHATGSAFIRVVMFFFAMIGALADVFAIILVPPYLQTGDVQSGLCTDKSKLPCWDAATISGPSAFNYRFNEVEIPIHGNCVSGGG
jgi:hypothetical protein